jgi:Cdc6-like AAA superfamily ATPase
LKSTPFIKWSEGKKETLFCPGIPGAGKTMLASIVINHLKTSFPDDNTGRAYLYCIYKRKDNQEADDLLASLLGQLAARQSITPPSLRRLYDEHRKGEKSRLSQNEIREELYNIIKTYSRTFIIIDALDECGTDHVRSELLSEIYKLQKLEETDIRLMVTFRPSIVLECPSSVTELEIRAHEEDIEEYLSGRMSELRSVVLDNNELQCKIRTRIVTLVDGMYVRLYPLSLII